MKYYTRLRRSQAASGPSLVGQGLARRRARPATPRGFEDRVSDVPDCSRRPACDGNQSSWIRRCAQLSAKIHDVRCHLGCQDCRISAAVYWAGRAPGHQLL